MAQFLVRERVPLDLLCLRERLPEVAELAYAGEFFHVAVML